MFIWELMRAWIALAADTGAAGGAEPADVPESDAGETFDEKRAMATIRAQRAEQRRLEAELKSVKLAAEQAKLSTEERLQAQLLDAQKRAEAAEKAAKTEALRSKVLSKAGKTGFVDPDDAWRFIDPDDVTDDNLEEQLAKLLKSKPYLGRAQSAGTFGTNGAGNGAGQGSAPKVSAGNTARPGGLTLDDVKRMSPQEMQRRMAEVDALLSGS